MLETRVLDCFAGTCRMEPGRKLLAAVSGGHDSVALLHLLLAVRDTLGVTIEVAHLNHGIRGADADEDARFVSDLAARHDLTLHQRTVDIPAILEAEGGSLEAVARRERYAFLEDARAVAGAQWIVTGHTADDQVETFLMNLFRGAGPRGLGGMMPAGPGPVCRPLLGTWREEIQSYLDAGGHDYRVDPTNADVSLTRNRIRLRVVPHVIAEMGPDVPRILARESRLMNEIEEFLAREGDAVLQRIGRETKPGEIRIDVPDLRAVHPALQRSVLRSAVQDLAGGLEEITLRHIEDVRDLMLRENGSAEAHLPRGVVARREYTTLVLAARKPEERESLEPSAPLALAAPGELRWGRVHLRWRVMSPPPSFDPATWSSEPERICLDRERVVEPVYVRGVKPADRIEPYGMEGGQKLSNLLVDRKVPRHDRTRVALLCDNGGSRAGERILWVVGQRRARFAPVGRETSQVLLLEAETIL